jgi:hypothetical protein
MSVLSRKKSEFAIVTIFLPPPPAPPLHLTIDSTAEHNPDVALLPHPPPPSKQSLVIF